MHIQNKADDLTVKCEIYCIHELPCVMTSRGSGSVAQQQDRNCPNYASPRSLQCVCPQYSCRQHRDTVTRTRTML